MCICENSIAEVQDLLNEALSLSQMICRVLPSLCILLHMCLCTRNTLKSIAAHYCCSPHSHAILHAFMDASAASGTASGMQYQLCTACSMMQGLQRALPSDMQQCSSQCLHSFGSAAMQQLMHPVLQKCKHAVEALTDVTSGGGGDYSQQVAHCTGSLPHILPREPRIAMERGVGPLQLCLHTSAARCEVLTAINCRQQWIQTYRNIQ